eukprot:snap_masked-scaffold1346_size46090-processed-gene-0.5 protein:Tk10770 transcript:snap_masked-scaffold1346_size46090-processed-gene-0.5-mRNA-1 annotation:"85 kda calcium-independent phospholipase a2"
MGNGGLFKGNRCDCRDFYVKKCEQASEKVCETFYKDHCRTIYKEHCEYETKQDCQTSYKEHCDYEQKQECQTTYREECKPSYNYEKKCKKIPEEKCHYVTVPKCHKVPQQHCKDYTVPHCQKYPEEHCCLSDAGISSSSMCFSRDIKHGGTPLHWSKSRKVIEALVESGCYVNSKNFVGHTALHLHVKHERLDCVLALIAYGAKIDIKDDQGHTALHMAVEIGNVTIIRALLVFEADTSLVNNEGNTPWMLAMKKQEASSVLEFTRDREAVLYSLYAIGASGCSTPTDKNGRELDFKRIKSAIAAKHRRVRCLFDEMLAQKAKYRKGVPQKGGRILCLDGGGIKGVVETRMLLSMEKIFGIPITHCFDWIIGTSTGGILALALVSGKSILECQIIYLRLKEKVFIDSKPYNTKPMEDLLKEEFGPNTKMYDIKGPK